MFVFRKIFWGLVFVSLGILLLLQNILGLDLPIWNIFWSVVVIAIGLSIIFGGSPRNQRYWRDKVRSHFDDDSLVFDEGEVKADKEDTNNVIFAKGRIDLSDIEFDKDLSKEINVIFSAGEIILPKDKQVKIKATSAFGTVRLPDGNSVSFGDIAYQTSEISTDKPVLYLTLNCVFGEAIVRK
jgi:hypothetical protein